MQRRFQEWALRRRPRFEQLERLGQSAHSRERHDNEPVDRRIRRYVMDDDFVEEDE